jgi:hypothetical protein
MIGRNRFDRISILLGASVLLIEIARLFFLLHLADSQLVQHIPDDAFYYVVLAQHFAVHAHWSFDGHAPSTGFHLLWAYMLVVLCWFDPKITLHGLVCFAGTVGAVALSTAAFLTALVVRRHFADRAVLGVAFIFLSATSLLQGVWLMESPLVILAAAAYMYIVTCQEGPLSRKQQMAAALIGLVGMFARSDFGLLPLCMVCAYGFSCRREKKFSQQLRVAASGLGGALFGLMIIVAHSYWISGHFAQGSAKEKLFWSQVEGFSTHRALQILFSFFYPLANMDLSTVGYRSSWLHMGASAIRLLTLCLLVCLLVKELSRRGALSGKVLVAAMVSTSIAYTVLYRFDSAAVQPWYAANYEVPVALTMAAALNSIKGALWRSLCTGAVVVWVLVGTILSCQGTWLAQAGHYRAGIYLLGHPELQPVGAWNGGIIAYFSGQPVTNLDGLVNDDVYPYSVANTLGAYISRRGIQYIIDTQDMFTGDRPRRGGYEGRGLTRCLDAKDEFLRDDTIDALGPIDTREALYHINVACLMAGGTEERASSSPGYQRSSHLLTAPSMR